MKTRPEFRIRAERRPRVGVARVLPRIVFPCLRAGLGSLRHGVEDPLRRAAHDVERLDVTGRHLGSSRAIEHGAADDDRVADDHRRRIEADVAPVFFFADQRGLQIDATVLAERRDRLARARVECDQLADACRDEDALLGAAADFAGPVRDAAMLPTGVRGPTSSLVGARIENPARRPGAGVDRRDLAERSGGVEHAVDHDRRRLEIAGTLARGGADERIVRTVPGPRDIQRAHVARVDLRER